jgi:hypothetical protein
LQQGDALHPPFGGCHVGLRGCPDKPMMGRCAPGDRSIAQRLDTMEQELGGVRQDLGDVKRLLTAVARAQGIDPDTIS